jgi:hypothetical protein
MSRFAIGALAVASLVRTAHAEVPDPMYACKPASASARVTVTLKPETSLADLAVWLTGFTCKNVVFSAEVAKHATRVTVVSSKPMSPRQAVQLFVDAIEATGLVVVQKPDTIVVKLGPNMPKACPDLAPAPAPVPAPVVAPPTPPAPPPITTADFDAGIRTIDATHRTITRALLDRVLDDPMSLAAGVRIVPAVRDNRPLGFKLYAIRPASLLARLGFVNGDTVQRINGRELSTPDKALELYVGLREAKELVVELERAGKPLTWTISIN